MPIFAMELVPPTAGLPAGVENVRGGEVRLSPRYPWLGGDVGFDAPVASGEPSGWTLDQTGGLGTRSVAQSEPNRVEWLLTGAAMDFGSNAPYLGRDIAGDFDVFCRVWMPSVSAGLFIPQLSAYSGRTGSQIVSMRFRHQPGFTNTYTEQFYFGGGAVDNVILNPYAARLSESLRTPHYLRIARSGNSWTAFTCRTRSIAWSQVGTVQSVALSSTVRLAVGMEAYVATSSPLWVQFSPVYTWPPLVTSSPQVIREYDAGSDFTQWDLSTFIENPRDELPRSFAMAGANVSYAWVVSNTSGAAFTATNQSLAQLQAAGVRAGRYLRLGVTLPNSGVQDTRWAGAVVWGTVPLGTVIDDGWNGGYNG
jgi:hypothetical protein